MLQSLQQWLAELMRIWQLLNFQGKQCCQNICSCRESCGCSFHQLGVESPITWLRKFVSLWGEKTKMAISTDSIFPLQTPPPQCHSSQSPCAPEAEISGRRNAGKFHSDIGKFRLDPIQYLPSFAQSCPCPCLREDRWSAFSFTWRPGTASSPTDRQALATRTPGNGRAISNQPCPMACGKSTFWVRPHSPAGFPPPAPMPCNGAFKHTLRISWSPNFPV